MHLAENTKDRPTMDRDFAIGSDVTIGQVWAKTTHVQLKKIFGNFVFSVGIDKPGRNEVI